MTCIRMGGLSTRAWATTSCPRTQRKLTLTPQQPSAVSNSQLGMCGLHHAQVIVAAMSS